MSDKPRIFISAVSKELSRARQLVANTLTFLGYEPVWQELFGTEQGDVADMLRRKIDTCQGLIQLTGQRFGFGATIPESDEHAVSYTQYELHYAREREKKVWPIILTEQYPPDEPNDEPEAHRQNQLRYRQSLAPSPKDNKRPVPLYQRAANPTELENFILKLRQPLAELHAESKLEQHRVRRFRLLAGVALFVIVILAIASVRLGWWIKSDNTQLKAILIEYVQRLTADPSARERGDEAAIERAILSDLDRKYGLPINTLATKLPDFAKKLASDHSASAYSRALGAYAVKDYLEAERLALEAANAAQKGASLSKSKVILALELAGNSAHDSQSYVRALTHYTAAAALTDKRLRPLEWARVHDALADALTHNERFAEAERLLGQVIPIRTEKLGPEHAETVGSRYILGGALFAQGKYDKAEVEYRVVLNYEKRVFGPDHRDTLASRDGLAGVMLGQGKYSEAEAEQLAVLKIKERDLGPEHPDTLLSRNNLVAALLGQEKYAEAEAECRAVLKVQLRVLGTNALITLTSRNSLGGALLAQGKYAEAEAEFRAVLKSSDRMFPPEHSVMLSSRLSLVIAVSGQGKYSQNETEHRAILKLIERESGPAAPITLMAIYYLAVNLEKQGKREEASEFARRAVEGSRKVLGAAHPETKRYEKLYQQLTAK